MKSGCRWTLVLAACLVFVVDCISKQLTHQYLPLMDYASPSYPYGGIPVFSNFLGIEFSLSHMTNKGAAWGMFGQAQVMLLVLRAALVVALSVYLWMYRKGPYALPLTLVIVGAVGNILDYFVYGHVVDMIHFVLWGYDFPVFNVADSAIFIGLFSVCLISLLEKKTSVAKS